MEFLNFGGIETEERLLNLDPSSIEGLEVGDILKRVNEKDNDFILVNSKIQEAIVLKNKKSLVSDLEKIRNNHKTFSENYVNLEKKYHKLIMLSGLAIITCFLTGIILLCISSYCYLNIPEFKRISVFLFFISIFNIFTFISFLIFKKVV